jgi:hypothetical protein
MSRAAKKATIGSGEFDAASPTLDLQDGTAEMVPQGSLEMFAELFDKLSGSHWFCDVGEA